MVVQRGLRTPTAPFVARFFIGIILGLVAEFAFMVPSTRMVLSSSAARWMDRKQIGGLEVPAWMFDRTACPAPGLLAVQPFVSIEALAALSALLDLALKISRPAFWRIQSLSQPESGRDSCRARRQCQGADTDTIDDRVRSISQICSGAGPSNGAIGAPAWPDLPAEARCRAASLPALGGLASET
jgi:hypothetical protein